MKPNDIRIDQQFDLVFEDGDFALGDSTEQNQMLILLSVPGEFKQFPTIGVGLEDYLNDERPGNLMESIRKNFLLDGMHLKRFTITEKGELDIDAAYE